MNKQILYSIETNTNAEYENVAPKEFDSKVLNFFNLKDVKDIRKIKKLNFNSELYVIDSKQDRFMLRSCDVNFLNRLRNQIELVSSLVSNAVKFKRARDRKYVAVINNMCWICYHFIEGDQFSGSLDSVTNAFLSTLTFNKELQEKGVILKTRYPDAYKSFSELKYNRNNWLFSLKILNEENDNISGLIEKPIYTEFKKTVPQIVDLCQKMCVPNCKDFSINHYDIQHSNIIENCDTFYLIDIEDIYLAPSEVAVGQAFFRLLRHCLRENREVSENHVNSVRLSMLNVASGLYELGVAELARGAFLRCINDISNIVCSAYNDKDKRLLYDINKKILNLLEIPYVFEISYDQLGVEL